MARQEREAATVAAQTGTGHAVQLGANSVGFGDPSGVGIDGWYEEMNVLNVAVNAASSSVAKRKGKDVETVKEVFRRRAKAEEKMPHMKGQKNAIVRGSRHRRGPVDEMEVDATEDELNEQETQGTLNQEETPEPTICRKDCQRKQQFHFRGHRKGPRCSLTP